MKILKYELVEADFKPWDPKFISVADSVCELIRTQELDVIHIGSTSFNVGGKGIIDLSVLYPAGLLSIAIERLYQLGFQDQTGAKPFPPNRPRKDGAVIVNGQRFLLHVHVIEKDSDEHRRQIQYKEYMLNEPSARLEYEASKKAILAAGVTEQGAYGKLKSPFVKSVLAGF